jgi:hypothetical protein
MVEVTRIDQRFYRPWYVLFNTTIKIISTTSVDELE